VGENAICGESGFSWNSVSTLLVADANRHTRHNVAHQLWRRSVVYRHVSRSIGYSHA